jgi:hypothetical protein
MEIKLNGKIAASGIQRCVLIDLNKSKIVKHKDLQKLINSNPGLLSLV